MKALVTGANGLIGSRVVRELLRDGVEVRAMIRVKSNTRNLDGLDIERVNGDIRDAESMKAALKGCDTFFQAAALYVNYAPKKDYYDINLEGTKIALNAALEQGINRVVYTSSVAAVGCGSAENPADEHLTFNLMEWDMDYITSKYLGEQAALEFVDKGLPVVVVNPSMVIGEGDIKPTPSGEIILRMINGDYPGYPEGGGNFVDVYDVARGHILAAEKGVPGERYILGNTNISYKELFQMVGEIAGVTIPRVKIPAGLMILLGYTYQAMSKITRKPPTLDAKMARLSCQYNYFDSSKAVKELGMPQTPIRETLKKVVSWFQENGYVKVKK